MRDVPESIHSLIPDPASPTATTCCLAQISATYDVNAHLSVPGIGLSLDNLVQVTYNSQLRLGKWLNIFTFTDLGAASGLESVVHEGPSTIGIDALSGSRGRIPHGFLRGAGLSDEMILLVNSLASDHPRFHTCFISYSTKDQDFADRLYADLQAEGVRCWFAPHDIQGGRKVHEQIVEAIKVYDKLLLILSEASMTSNWVKAEIANARAREEQQKRQMLFPITLVPFDGIKGWKLFDADTGTDSAREIREYFVPDFSNWKDPNSYTKVFERLVRDLKAQPGEKAAGTTD